MDRVQDPRNSDETLQPPTIDLREDNNENTAQQTGKKSALMSEVSCSSSQTNVQDKSKPSVDVEKLAPPKTRVIKVSRAQRRGLLSRFTLVPEVTDPRDYDNSVKWLVTAIVGLAAAAAPVGSSIIFPVLDQISVELHSTPETSNLTVAFYMLAMGLFPLWWSSFSEAFGRRNVYLISFVLYTVFSALAAWSKSIALLIVFRLLAGGAAASVQAVGAGTIADCWAPFERGRAMSYYYLGPLMGPLLAPIIGGALGQKFGWRSTQWAQVIWGGLITLLLLFVLPETLVLKKDPVARAEQEISEQVKSSASESTPARSAVQHRIHLVSLKWAKALRMMIIDPLSVVLYLQYMPILLIIYYAAVTYSTLYVLNISIQYTFARPPYEFSTLIVGLLYIPNSLGYVLASVFGGRWIDKIMAREARKAHRYDDKGKLIFLPEDRMHENAWLGAVLYPCALIWYGWSAGQGVFWIVPMIANFFYGVGSMLIFTMATTMLTEFMPKKASSGIALSNLARNSLCAVGTVVVVPIIKGIGDGWLFTILGIWAASSSVVIWAMRRNGPQWRKRMQKALS